MKRTVTRRDFLNGVAIGVGGALMPDALAGLDPHLQRTDYPPAQTGLRGSHPGSFEAAHALRDGMRVSASRDTGEHYDLIVVGAGISGLSSAYFYRQGAGDSAKVLVLDNHDDFGGHAKRNEFTSAGRRMLGYGGTMLIDTPAGYPPVAQRLLDELGIDLVRFETTHHRDLFAQLGLSRAAFLNAERFGADFLAVGDPSTPGVLADAPLSAEGKAQLRRLYANDRHYLDTENREAQIAYLESVSYETYLLERAGIGPEALAMIADVARG
ncbi:MAG: NAD(P)/FAD-dependent oxidoreductase, partial [Pseudomonadales bacterium]|nr:NAD(P)/FAD-dependent oxidoreductase [Pseudomonadales bacterium]